MTQPVRIQRSRVKGWHMPPNTIIVSRPSEWGNPWRVAPAKLSGGGEGPTVEWWVENPNINGIYRFSRQAEAHEAAVKLYRHWIEHGAPTSYADRARLALRGKNLACYCRPDLACHADVLLELANR